MRECRTNGCTNEAIGPDDQGAPLIILRCEDCHEMASGGFADWANPPRHEESVHLYVFEGIPMGGFLTAIFSNQFVDAFQKADSINLELMSEWAHWLYWHAPPGCWRSRQQMKAWIEAGGWNGMHLDGKEIA